MHVHIYTYAYIYTMLINVIYQDISVNNIPITTAWIILCMPAANQSLH